MSRRKLISLERPGSCPRKSGFWGPGCSWTRFVLFPIRARILEEHISGTPRHISGYNLLGVLRTTCFLLPGAVQHRGSCCIRVGGHSISWPWLAGDWCQDFSYRKRHRIRHNELRCYTHATIIADDWPRLSHHWCNKRVRVSSPNYFFGMIMYFSGLTAKRSFSFSTPIRPTSSCRGHANSNFPVHGPIFQVHNLYRVQ